MEPSVAISNWFSGLPIYNNVQTVSLSICKQPKNFSWTIYHNRLFYLSSYASSGSVMYWAYCTFPPAYFMLNVQIYLWKLLWANCYDRAKQSFNYKNCNKIPAWWRRGHWTPHHLEHPPPTKSKIKHGHQGAPKWPTGYWTPLSAFKKFFLFNFSIPWNHIYMAARVPQNGRWGLKILFLTLP